MVTFGNRVKAVRKELGFTQGELAERLGPGYNQGRISKIEIGALDASVRVIEKIASVFGRAARDLVQGTDREGYYFAQGLSSEERTAARATHERAAEILAAMNALSVMMLKTYYGMVFDLFEAVYGGDYIAPQVSAEEGYVELRSQCQRLAHIVNEFEPATSEKLYFPDHIEQRDDMDMLMDDWKMGERGMVKESLSALFQISERYRHLVDSAVLDEVKRHFKLDEGQQAIAAVHAQREKIEASWRKQFLNGPSAS
jgi:transcriptional regulator with XRE-family HTH domain